MQFTITIKHDRKSIKLVIEKIGQTDAHEKYRIIARNQTFVLQNNRPVIKARGLKHFPLTWKVIEGGYSYRSILDSIIKELEKKI